MSDELLPTIDFSPAKAHLSDLMTDVFHRHRLTLVSRHRGKERMFLVSPEDLLSMLPSHPFQVEVTYDEASVALAVPELGVLGIGETVEAAADDLLIELRAYARRFFANPARYLAAGQGHRLGSLVAFALADDEGQRRMVLEADEPEPAEALVVVGA